MSTNRRILPLLLLLAALGPARPLAAQGGRDNAEGVPLVLFVRSHRTTESKEIYDAAWKALEPHFFKLARERLYDFDGEKRRADHFFAEHKGYRTVVCFDEDAVPLCPHPKKVVLTQSRTDRREVGRVMRLLRPLARRLFILGDEEETLPGFERVDRPGDADLAWVTEDFTGAVPKLSIPLVSTSPRVDGLVTVRPDPRGVGQQLAAQLLFDRKERAPVSRQRVVVEMGDPDERLPLPLLARADIVRRAP